MCLYEVAHRLLGHLSVAVLVAPQLIGRGNYGIIAEGFTGCSEKHGQPHYIATCVGELIQLDVMFENICNEIEFMPYAVYADHMYG